MSIKEMLDCIDEFAKTKPDVPLSEIKFIEFCEWWYANKR